MAGNPAKRGVENNQAKKNKSPDPRAATKGGEMRKRDRLCQFKLSSAHYENLKELAESREQTVSAFVRGVTMAEIGTYLGKLKEYLDERIED